MKQLHQSVEAGDHWHLEDTIPKSQYCQHLSGWIFRPNVHDLNTFESSSVSRKEAQIVERWYLPKFPPTILQVAAKLDGRVTRRFNYTDP